jgi:hypothetical protein
MSDEVLCPRRSETPGGPFRYGTGPDEPIDGRCPYCGSLMSDAFMQRVRAGDQLGPTDKSYKVYLDEPWAKFYFQHLDEASRHEFIELLNAKRLNIGYPGRFYVLPYFIATKGS